MSSFRLLLAAAALSMPALALGQEAPVGATPDRVAAIADCKGRWFEASAIIDPSTRRGTRVRLCSKEGATDAEWAATLKAAADQLEKRDMPAAPKAELLAEINAAIAGIGKPVPAAPPSQAASTPIAPAPIAASPPPPPPPPTPPVLAGTTIGTAAAPATVSAATAPSIDLKCAARGQPGEGNCGLVGRETILVIKAAAGLDQGARLRLLRRGEDRGEIRLPDMRPGQVLRAGLPEKLCTGVNSSKVEFQLVGPGGATGKRFGPFSLRC